MTLTDVRQEEATGVVPVQDTPPYTKKPTFAQRWGQRLRSEGGIVVIVSFVSYLIVALLLDFKYHVYPLDGVSRMANAYYVVYSRDPHLAAIGFVWNPLPSIATMPFLLLKDIWAPFTTEGMAASLVTVIAMTGAVYQLLRCLGEWGVPRLPRLLLTALFALNPMILFYAGNGMSEALYLFTLLATARYLVRWLRDGDIRSLLYAAIWLGLAYLARNEAAAATLFGSIVVFTVSFRKRAQPSAFRAAFSDLAIFGLPFAASFVGWALASQVITGQLFPQFSSQYGNTSQIAVNGAHVDFSYRFGHELKAITYMAPGLLLIVVLALMAASARRLDKRVWGMVSVLSGSLVFSLITYMDGKIFPWFRFYILLIPIEILLVGAIVAGMVAAREAALLAPQADGTAMAANRQARLRTATLVMSALAVLVLVGPSLITTGAGMFNPTVGQEETNELGFIVHTHLTPQDKMAEQDYAGWTTLDHYFTAMHLSDGDVVVDTFSGCIPSVYTSIGNPKVFVITNDRDFQRVLSDPLTFGAHYMLVPDPTGLGSLEALNKQYPTLYSTGAGFTKLVHKFPAKGECPSFRLYHVFTHPTEVG